MTTTWTLYIKGEHIIIDKVTKNSMPGLNIITLMTCIIKFIINSKGGQTWSLKATALLAFQLPQCLNDT